MNIYELVCRFFADVCRRKINGEMGEDLLV
jgi:hypothetical protein